MHVASGRANGQGVMDRSVLQGSAATTPAPRRDSRSSISHKTKTGILYTHFSDLFGALQSVSFEMSDIGKPAFQMLKIVHVY